MVEKLDLRLRHVAAQHVLSTRRTVSGWDEIERDVASLANTLGDLLIAPPVCLLLAHVDDGYLVEFALPVADGTSRDGFESKSLPDDHVIAAMHRGPLPKIGEDSGIAGTAQAAVSQASERKRLIGDNPTRYVFLENVREHDDDASQYVTEIQISYHLPVWLDRLEQGASEALDPAVLEGILPDVASIAASDDPDAIRSWVMRAVERMESAIPDPQTRACILQDCAHRYPRIQLERMRAVYEEIGDLRAFVQRLAEDKDLFPGKIWMDQSGAPIAYIQRSVPPWNREAYDATDDPVEKRYLSCFCVMVRDAIRTGEPISPDFCNCSGGWFVQMWDAILDGRLRVDVVESVLRGDDRCVFAIHLPEELL